MRRNRSPLLPIIVFFILLNALFLVGRNFLERSGFDQSVLIIGNLVLFAATPVSFVFAKRGLKSENPQAFVRSVYMSIMIKLFICLIAASDLYLLFRKNLNRPSTVYMHGIISCLHFY